MLQFLRAGKTLVWSQPHSHTAAADCELATDEQLDAAYQEVTDVVAVPRGLGFWGDMVVTLRSKDKIELRALPQCAPAAYAKCCVCVCVCVCVTLRSKDKSKLSPCPIACPWSLSVTVL